MGACIWLGGGGLLREHGGWGRLGVCIVLVVSWQCGVVHERPGLGLLQFGIATRNVDHLVGWKWGRQLLPGYGERLCCETFFWFLASAFFGFGFVLFLILVSCFFLKKCCFFNGKMACTCQNGGGQKRPQK